VTDDIFNKNLGLVESGNRENNSLTAIRGGCMPSKKQCLFDARAAAETEKKGCTMSLGLFEPGLVSV